MNNNAPRRNLNGRGFARSEGHVRTRVPSAYYYYPDIYKTYIPFADFAFWNNTPKETDMYSLNEGVTELKLYDGATKELIGTIVDTYTCTPKVGVGVSKGPVTLIVPAKPSASPSCPTTYESNLYFNTETPGILGLMHMKAPSMFGDLYMYQDKPSDFGYTIGTSLATSATGAASSTFSEAPTLSLITYKHPTNTQPLIKVGNRFYPHRLFATIEDDYIDDWSNGKFLDTSEENPEGTYPDVIHRRAGKNFTEFTMVWAAGFTFAYDSCYVQASSAVVPSSKYTTV